MYRTTNALLLAALLSSACQNQPNPGTNVNDDGGGTGGGNDFAGAPVLGPLQVTTIRDLNSDKYPTGTLVQVTGATAAEVARADGLDARVLDVRDGAAVKALVGALPALDVLVNCAGVIRRGQEHDPEVFAEVLDINLAGTQRCCAAARPLQQRSCRVPERA